MSWINEAVIMLPWIFHVILNGKRFQEYCLLTQHGCIDGSLNGHFAYTSKKARTPFPYIERIQDL